MQYQYCLLQHELLLRYALEQTPQLNAHKNSGKEKKKMKKTKTTLYSALSDGSKTALTSISLDTIRKDADA